MKSRITWILIADGGRARILSQEATGGRLFPVEGMAFTHSLQKTSDLVRDRQPRSFESVGKMRHPVDTGLDPHRAQKEEFARELAKVLETEASRKAYDELVIVAPPKALGAIREALPDQVRSMVKREVAKDLTKTPDSEIAQLLGSAD